MLNPELIAPKPEDLGIDSDKLETVFARVRRDVDDGVLPSAQVAIARNGKLAGMRTFGSAIQGGEERQATDETLYSIFSSTKAVVGVAVWLLFEEGLLKLEERVANIIPGVRDQWKGSRNCRASSTAYRWLSLRALAPGILGRPREAPRSLWPLALELGAGDPIRVPPNLSPLGAVGDH
jgi:CubicO group peptidase (beta-lactamase class C family)